MLLKQEFPALKGLRRGVEQVQDATDCLLSYRTALALFDSSGDVLSQPEAQPLVDSVESPQRVTTVNLQAPPL
jgi:hypothetical protein